MATIDQWQAWAASHLLDELSWLSAEGAWDKVVLYGGALAREVRKALDHEAASTPSLDGAHRVGISRAGERAIAMETLWLLATCERLNFSLMDAAWSKYPAVCPYCIRDQDRQWPELLRVEPGTVEGATIVAACTCHGDRPEYTEVKHLIAPFRARLDLRPETIIGMERMFDGIFGAAHEEMQLASIAFHVQEEAAEVLAELKDRNLECAKDEVADEFSWLASLACHPKIRPQHRAFGLEILLERYVGGPDRALPR